MAERRMFAKTIIDSDAFLDMPITSRLLYYDLCMRADDDGFVNAPKKIMRITGASMDDIRILSDKKFIIPFNDGLVVIKHWRIHNYIRKDTYTETKYKEEKAQLQLDENNAYTQNFLPVRDESVTSLSQYRDESVVGTSTQVRIGKDSIGKDSIGKDSIGKGSKGKDSTSKEENIEKKHPNRHRYGQYKNVLLSDTDYSKLVSEFPDDHFDRIERLSEYMASTGKSYKNHLATIRNWARKDAQSGSVKHDDEFWRNI